MASPTSPKVRVEDTNDMIVNHYELICILVPEMTEDEFQRIRQRLQGIIEEFHGGLLFFSDWAVRKLAYSIKKNTRGRYIYWRFTASPECVAELERIIRIESNIIRFLTIRLGQNVDAEALMAEAEKQRVAEHEDADAQDTEARDEKTPKSNSTDGAR